MNAQRVHAGRIRHSVLTLAVGGASMLLGACVPGGLDAIVPGGLPAIRIASGTVTDSGAKEAGQQAERRPSGDTEQAAADLRASATAQTEAASGILAKNSSKFSGAVMAPPGIIAKHSSKYRVASFEQVPSAGGLVVLMTPDGFYFLDGKGQPITATTDDAGRYDFGTFTIPAGRDVLVVASFPGNRLLYGYAHSAAGENRVDVDTAGTFVSAYLVAQGRRLGRSPASVDLAWLPRLHDLTRAMLDDGSLALDPDLLAMERAGDFVASYQAAFRARSPELGQAWDALLGL